MYKNTDRNNTNNIIQANTLFWCCSSCRWVCADGSRPHTGRGRSTYSLSAPWLCSRAMLEVDGRPCRTGRWRALWCVSPAAVGGTATGIVDGPD